MVLHGESNTDQASPRTPTQRTFQPQEAVQPQRNQTILQANTPAQKANYSRQSWCHKLNPNSHSDSILARLLSVTDGIHTLLFTFTFTFTPHGVT